MSIRLQIQGSEAFDNEAKDECIKQEVGASVQQSPYMNIAYCVNALFVIENIFTFFANEETSPGTEEQASK